MRVAIVFQTRYGQTEKIAQRLADQLKSSGHEVTLLPIRKRVIPPSVSEFDMVLIGAPVYAGRYPPTLLNWVSRQNEALNRLSCGFFSVSLNAADPRPKARREDDRLLREFLEQSGLHPEWVASLAGALHYRKYNLLIRYMMKRISAKAKGPTDTSRDHEMTDWARVDAFASAVAAKDRNSEFATQRRFPLVASLPLQPVGHFP